MLINCIESTVIKNSESLILSILNISNSYYARLLKLKLAIKCQNNLKAFQEPIKFLILSIQMCKT